MATSPTKKESTKPPPPVIGKAGRYTVFLTPPSKPTNSSPIPSDSPNSTTPPPPPPVRPPPQQFDKLPSSRTPTPSFRFFWDALAKVQDVHSSVDACLAEWLGLEQSKYQWALNDYYESKGIEKEAAKAESLTCKGQHV